MVRFSHNQYECVYYCESLFRFSETGLSFRSFAIEIFQLSEQT